MKDEKVKAYLELARAAYELRKGDLVYENALKALEIDPRNAEAWELRFWSVGLHDGLAANGLERSLCVEKLLALGKTNVDLDLHYHLLFSIATELCETAKTIESEEEYDARFSHILQIRCAIPNSAIPNDEVLAMSTERLACAYVLMLADYMERFHSDGRIPETYVARWKNDLSRINQGLPPEQITAANDPEKVFTTEYPEPSAEKKPQPHAGNLASALKSEGGYQKEANGAGGSGGKASDYALPIAFVLLIILLLSLLF